MNITTASRTTTASGATQAILASLLALFAVSALSLIGARPAWAATVRSWTGAGANGNWTNPANWVGGAPVAGDILDFGYNTSRKTNVNDFPADTTFSAITFSDTGYSLGGNRVRLTNGVTTYDSGFSPWTETLNLAIVVANSQSFTASEAHHTISYKGGFVLTAGATFQGRGHQIVSGPVTGAGAIVAVEGTLTLAGTSSGSGSIKVTGHSYVVVTGSYPGRAVSTDEFGHLMGSGTIGPLAIRGGLVYPMVPSPLRARTLGVVGNLTESGSAPNYAVVVNGTAAGQYSQLVVSGYVKLAATYLGVYSVPTGPIVKGQEIVIIKNNGPAAVSGTFSNLPEGSTVTDKFVTRSYRVSYKGGASGRDVTLTVLTAG